MKKLIPEFKKNHTYWKRSNESHKILNKYSNKIPIILELIPNEKTLPKLDKTKFLVPSELTLAQFMMVIRKRITLGSECSLHMYCNNILPCTSTSMNELYNEHKDADGFLYIFYCGENTFGY